MMKQKNLEISSFPKVLCRLRELDLKHKEDYCIADTIGGSYENENFDEVVEWINEVEKFIDEIKLELDDKGNRTNNSLWCRNTLSTIRKISAKRDALNSSFPSTNSPREELGCEIALLVNVYFAQRMVVEQVYSYNEVAHQRINAVESFLGNIKLQLQDHHDDSKNHDHDHDWYSNKIAETKKLIDMCEPSLSSRNRPPLSSLHEKLRCEVRSLINIRCVFLLTARDISTEPSLDLQEKNKYMTEVKDWISKVNRFLTEMDKQLEDPEFTGKDSHWYRTKIEETETLIAKRYAKKSSFQIYLCFRGQETRHGITRTLYEALNQEGLEAFMDDERHQYEDSIAPDLTREIENSNLSIIIFSQNFADSSRSLDEVVKILECKEKNNQLVLPIFYKVEPSDVRHQKNSYKEAMFLQEIMFGKDSDKVKKWRSSLFEVCNLKAFGYKENRYEYDFVQKIVKEVKNIQECL